MWTLKRPEENERNLPHCTVKKEKYKSVKTGRNYSRAYWRAVWFCAGFIESILDHRVSVFWLSMTNTWVSPFPTDVSCSLPHLQKGSLAAALCVSALMVGLTVPPAHTLQSHRDAGSATGSRRIGCWNGRPKTKLWTPLTVRGEKTTYPEPDSSFPCAHAKRTGKTPSKCLFLSVLQREPSCLTERRDVKRPEIRWYQSHHSFSSQGNFTQGLDIQHLYVDTIMCGDTCMCNIIPVCMRNCHLQDGIKISLIALPSCGHLVLKTV